MRVFPEAPFSWKLLKIGSLSAKGIEKTSPPYNLFYAVYCFPLFMFMSIKKTSGTEPNMYEKYALHTKFLMSAFLENSFKSYP